jgi:hypothetical protein
MNTVRDHVLGLFGVAGTFAAVYKAFATFDRDQSDENRQFVYQWLLGLRVNPLKWEYFFRELFERFFGAKHFSLKCAGRSMLLSASLIVAVNVFFLYEGAIRLPFVGQVDAFELKYYLVILACGCVADYFSLWKTRIILTSSKVYSNVFAACAVVAVDFVATTVIYVAILSIPGVIIRSFIEPFHSEIEFVGQSVIEILTAIFRYRIMTLSLLYVVSLLTSAWLWVYLVVAYGMRAAGFLPAWLGALSRVMDVEKHPVRTIGYVAATVSAIIMGVFALL